eukprot:CAMPEP_0172726992 /NCGR_PEP_ID=MMETSP1074-20121228/91424_1 /TAXON_ID=2916 /ORGANISM="Ceratium fusus, Strain PA161109" /LENGTH=406 /DNA_ID=CAMNT_0013554101 /DNA_START=41 /DNA_END=1257 /DNA_ORIENTATION=-
MTDTQGHAKPKTSVLTWLEDTLREERQVVGIALARQHVALMKQLAPQLEGVQWKGDPPVQKQPLDLTVLRNGQELGIEWSEIKQAENRFFDHRPETSVPRSMPSDMEGDQTPVRNLAPARNILVEEPTSPPSKVVASHWAIGSDDDGAELQRLPKEEGMPVMNGVAADPVLEVPEVEMDMPPCKRCFERIKSIVGGPYFEGTFAMLILLNIFIMAIESQYIGIDGGFRVGYHSFLGYDSSASDAWPGADTVFEVIEWIFGVVFTLELAVKIAVFGIGFFKEVWNVVDLVIVGSWLVSAFGTLQLPIDPMLLRLARLARLLRVLRLVRTVRMFDSLYLMTTSMTGSISVLVWSVVLLFLVQMMLAFLLQQLTIKYIQDENKSLQNRRQVFKYYGSFARSMLSMFEIT